MILILYSIFLVSTLPLLLPILRMHPSATFGEGVPDVEAEDNPKLDYFISLIYRLWHNKRMKFDELLEIIHDEPIFETGLLLAGDVDPKDIRRQLSRWTKAGRIIQLRRGLYALAPPFQKVEPHPFIISNRLVRGSYVSCQSALAHYDLIPEYVPTVIGVSCSKPGRWDTSLGSFVFRFIKPDFFFGTTSEDLGGGQHAFLASPEKALLDLIHFTPGGDSEGYLENLRLQNLWDAIEIYAAVLSNL